MAARAVAVEDKKLLYTFMGGVDRSNLKGVVSKLQFTIKTHKIAGEVIPRALHTYNACPMLPGMKWLSAQL